MKIAFLDSVPTKIEVFQPAFTFFWYHKFSLVENKLNMKNCKTVNSRFLFKRVIFL